MLEPGKVVGHKTRYYRLDGTTKSSIIKFDNSGGNDARHPCKIGEEEGGGKRAGGGGMQHEQRYRTHTSSGLYNYPIIDH